MFLTHFRYSYAGRTVKRNGQLVLHRVSQICPAAWQLMQEGHTYPETQVFISFFLQFNLLYLLERTRNVNQQLRSRPCTCKYFSTRGRACALKYWHFLLKWSFLILCKECGFALTQCLPYVTDDNCTDSHMRAQSENYSCCDRAWVLYTVTAHQTVTFTSYKRKS